MTMDQYRGMLSQATRVEAFRQRIQQVVHPGDRVLEIGAGLGTFSFFAAQAGAARVWAVEGGPIVNVARALARYNGLDDRVQFIRGWFPGVTIPEPIDVLIFENYAARLVDPATWRLLAALHAHVLAPGARIVPDHARLWVVPVCSERNWRIVGPLGPEDAAYGVEWTPTRPLVYNQPLPMPLQPEDFRHDPVMIAEVNLARPVTPAALSGEAQWTFAADVTIHGLGFWFELELEPGTWLSNRPGADPASWGHLYLPVAEPMVLGPGETLTARVAPEAAPEGGPGWLTWELATPRERFRGHEFLSEPASRADLVQAGPGRVPRLSRQTAMELEVLQLADGTRTMTEIADETLRRGIVQSEAEAVALAFAVLEGKTDDALA